MAAEKTFGAILDRLNKTYDALASMGCSDTPVQDFDDAKYEPGVLMRVHLEQEIFVSLFAEEDVKVERGHFQTHDRISINKLGVLYYRMVSSAKIENQPAFNVLLSGLPIVAKITVKESSVIAIMDDGASPVTLEPEHIRLRNGTLEYWQPVFPSEIGKLRSAKISDPAELKPAIVEARQNRQAAAELAELAEQEPVQ